MQEFLWFVLGGFLLVAFWIFAARMTARDKREEEALSAEELKVKRALERLASDFVT